MSVPFVLGLIVGGGAVLAYNRRKEIQALLQKENYGVTEVLSKGKEMAVDVKNTLMATKETIRETLLEKKQEIIQKKAEMTAVEQVKES